MVCYLCFHINSLIHWYEWQYAEHWNLSCDALPRIGKGMMLTVFPQPSEYLLDAVSLER